MAEKQSMVIQELLTGEKLGNNRLFARVTIFPGKELGYHEHHGETETYHIISGEGEYDDNGKKQFVSAGDTVFCPEGGGHGIRNTGKNDLVFIALIIKE